MVGCCWFSGSVVTVGRWPMSPRSWGFPGSARTGGSRGSWPRASRGWRIDHRGRAGARARTPSALESSVLQARREQRRGQDWLAAETGVPARTVSRILRRHQVPYLRDCDPLTGEVIRASKATAVRYERDRPGELVHMDVKKIGRIHDGGGWKAHGREHGQTGAQKKARIGFDYVHSLVDDHSRLAYSEILTDEKGATCAAFLLRAAEAFANFGITRIERVMTDNHIS